MAMRRRLSSCPAKRKPSQPRVLGTRGQGGCLFNGSPSAGGCGEIALASGDYAAGQRRLRNKYDAADDFAVLEIHEGCVGFFELAARDLDRLQFAALDQSDEFAQFAEVADIRSRGSPSPGGGK